MRNISLIGMSGAGKSQIAVGVGRQLGIPVVEMDRLLAEYVGSSLDDFISRSGEGGFLQAEEEFYLETLARIDVPSVISTGGSVAYLPHVLKLLRTKSAVVYIHVAFADLEMRIGNGKGRSIIGLESKGLKGVYDERIPLYRSSANIEVISSGVGTIDQDVLRVIDALTGLAITK